MRWILLLAFAERLVLLCAFFRQQARARERERREAATAGTFAARQRVALRLENCICVCRHERLTYGALTQDERN